LLDRVVTAQRIVQNIGGILRFATAVGARAQGDNPAKWWEAVSAGLDVEHTPVAFKAFPYTEIPAFFEAVKDEESTAWRALEFLFLTGQRCKQVRHLVWREIRLDYPQGPVWICPPERRKQGHEDLILPLPPAAVALLRRQEPGAADEPVFPGKRGARFLSDTTLWRGLQKLAEGRWKDYTLHGSSRACFGSWAEDNGHRQVIIDRCLAHEYKNKVQRAYQRQDLRGADAPDKLLDESRVLMNAWADYCASA
jgi:integrase